MCILAVKRGPKNICYSKFVQTMCEVFLSAVKFHKKGLAKTAPRNLLKRMNRKVKLITTKSKRDSNQKEKTYI
jgi:hypothetical protein